jgi:hypothetical protein
VAAVVRGAPLGLARPHRQHRLGALDRLHLGLLVDAQDQGAVRRGEVEPDDVPDLLHERGIGGEPGALDPVRLEAEGVPDPLHGGRRQAARGRHRAGAPVRGALRHGLQGAGQQLGDPFVRDGARGAATGPVAQAVEPVLGEALAPLADRVGADPDLAGDGLVRRAFGTAEHDLRPERQVLRGLAPADQLLQLASLLRRQRERRRLALRHGTAPPFASHAASCNDLRRQATSVLSRK